MRLTSTAPLALLAALATALLPTKVTAAPSRGIAWPYFETTPASAFSPGAKWVYNYERYTPTGGSYAGMEFVPMVSCIASRCFARGCSRAFHTPPIWIWGRARVST